MAACTYPAPPLLSGLGITPYCNRPLGGGKLWYASPGTNSAAAQTEAENFDSMAGIATESTYDTGGGLNVGFVNNTTGDSYVAFHSLDFGTGPASVSSRVASAVANGSIEFHLDSHESKLVATTSVGNTGGWQGWQTITAMSSGASGVHDLFVVFKNAPSNLNWFRFNFPPPSPWIAEDVGAVEQAGTTVYNAGTFTVAGSGTDIEGSADAFRYVYQPASSECEVRARVVSLQGTSPWAKAGLMIRESTAPGAANATVVVTSANGVAFQRRTIAGGGTTSTIVSGITAPRWLRLVRTATNSFTGYYSDDGTNWTPIGTSVTVPMSNTVVAGLAVAAHDNTTNCVAMFDRVCLNQAPVLTPISNHTLVAGQTLLVTNAATDADVPAQTLTYSLVSLPSGAAINPNTGVLSWRPTMAQSPSTQTVSVGVSDSGIPALSATQNFKVTVTRPTSPSLGFTTATYCKFGLWISGDAGPDYTVLASTNLTLWQPVATTNSPRLPWLWADTNAALFPFRFYRVLLGP